MVELHGWALIRENFTVDNEDIHLEEILNGIAGEIEKLRIDDALLRINYSNGEAILTATRFTNHFSSDINGIINLFKQIATVAPGSYGLLYLYNDEDVAGFKNAFQVLVLSRGTVKWQADHFLSPYIPTVEDEEIFN